jgi:hypothetical protein
MSTSMALLIAVAGTGCHHRHAGVALKVSRAYYYEPMPVRVYTGYAVSRLAPVSPMEEMRKDIKEIKEGMAELKGLRGDVEKLKDEVGAIKKFVKMPQ